MIKSEAISYFHIKTDVYYSFVSLEADLYNELKRDPFTPDLDELLKFNSKFRELEANIRVFQDKFKDTSLEDFTANNKGVDCLVLDVTHRPDLLSYICAIQLLLLAIVHNNNNAFVALLLSVMNQYSNRGDKQIGSLYWNLQNSTFH